MSRIHPAIEDASCLFRKPLWMLYVAVWTANRTCFGDLGVHGIASQSSKVFLYMVWFYLAIGNASCLIWRPLAVRNAFVRTASRICFGDSRMSDIASQSSQFLCVVWFCFAVDDVSCLLQKTLAMPCVVQTARRVYFLGVRRQVA